MKPLVYEPERGLQTQLGAFLQDKVFIEEEDGKRDDISSVVFFFGLTHSVTFELSSAWNEFLI